MFKPKTVKIFSVLAIMLSIIGLLLSIAGTLLVADYGLAFFVGIVSWALLLWASWIGLKLSSYKLYDDEFKKVGIRIYLIIGAFFLFFFVGIIVGLFIAIILLSTLWALKSNYDDWEYSNSVPEVPAEMTNEP